MTTFAAFANGQEGEKPKAPVWVYGINDHIDVPTELPADFKPSGSLCIDFKELCSRLGIAAHPAFKFKKRVVREVAPRRPSIMGSLMMSGGSFMSAPAAELSPPSESTSVSVRSMLMDRTAISLIGLLLPSTTSTKVLSFSDCHVDCEMLRSLRSGLVERCSVESLQLEWNSFDLPLPPADAVDVPISRFDVEASVAEGSDAGKDESTPLAAASRIFTTSLLDARERLRYTTQSQRLLRSFREWIESIHGSMAAAWGTLRSRGVNCSSTLTAGEFHEVLSDNLGVYGPQVLEVFEVLDGPDYIQGQARPSMDLLKAAMLNLPEEAKDNSSDPIGVAIAQLIDQDSVLESLSLRACGITRLELEPISATLASNSWQLRCLNLWENRICDRGAELLASALDAYRGLEFLNLARNRISAVGLQSLCKPYKPSLLTEAECPAARERIKSQQAQTSASKPKTEVCGSRQKRHPVVFIDELEERPTVGPNGEPLFLLRRPSELRVLQLSENPIKGTEIVESLQTHGPRGAELVLRGTPVAIELAVKRPDLLASKEKKVLLPGVSTAKEVIPDGWILRIN